METQAAFCYLIFLIVFIPIQSKMQLGPCYKFVGGIAVNNNQIAGEGRYFPVDQEIFAIKTVYFLEILWLRNL
jgi:hypothetical protein